MKEFQITGEYIELFKLLKAEGLCATGGEAKSVIEHGSVSVDGEIETRKRRKIFPGSVVRFDSESIRVTES